jgi:hypothetical protein
LVLLRPGVDGSEGWRLAAIDAATGAGRPVSKVDLPAGVQGLRGIGMHPDGKRFLASVPSFHYDIWMFEGFDVK